MKDHVAGFGGAGGPDEIQRVTTQMGAEPLAGLLQRLLGALAQPMRAGWVAGELFGRIEPGRTRFGQQRRGGVVIEVKHRPRSLNNTCFVARGTKSKEE
jgi:hypothetical protein